MLTLDDIRGAATLLQGAVVRTPCLRSQTLSAVTGADVWVKFENLQFTASFKERGALTKLSSLSDAERRAGVIAMSAGNHAQGVARHAARLGIPATIVMPVFTPFNKVRHTREFGARVLLEGNTLGEAGAHARELAAREGLVFVHPFDDPRIVAGQGTVGLEMLEDAPELETIVVPVGGGGLIAGIAVAVKALKPAIRLVGVETESYPSLYQRRHGEPVRTGGQTIAEGIAVPDIGAVPLELLEGRLDEVLLVSEAHVERAVVMFLEIEKAVAEGAGAAGLAALLAYPERFRGRKVGIVLCGGNIDTRLLASILLRGLVRDGRLVRLRVAISDAPGTLSRVTGAVGAAGGNIVDVAHQRLFGTIAAKSAELDLVVETRDRAHGEEIMAAVAAAGFKVAPL